MNLLDLAVKVTIDDQATAKIGTISNSIKSGLGTAAKVGAAALAAGTAAVGAFAASSIQAGMNFDSAMSQVAATMGTTVDQIGELRDFAQEMGATTAFSATQAAEALNYMALAGYDANTSMEMLPNVLNLAAAGGMELASASDMITDAQSALGLTLDQTSDMVDQMAAASSKTNTSVEQLGSAILTVGGTAKNLKGGTVELSQALGLLADNGIKGAEGGTALRNVLLGISSEKFESTFGELGVAAYDAEGNMRSLKDIFADMNTAMADMTVEEKTKALSEAFNKVDLKSLNALLATDAERWDEVEAAISDSAGAAERMAETQLDNLAGDVTLFKSAFEGLQIALSDQATPALREFVQFGTDALSQLTEAMKEGGFAGFAEKFGEIVQDGLTSLIEALPRFLETGTQIIGSIVSGLQSALPTMISQLAASITAMANYIIENADAMLEAAGEFFMSIATAVVDALPQILTALGSMLVTLIGSIVTHLPDIIAAAFELFGGIITGLWEAAVNIGTEIGNMLQGAVDAIGEWVGSFVEAGANLIQGLIDGFLSGVGDFLAAVGGAVQQGDWAAQQVGQIASPSKLMKKRGKQLIEGLALGITDNMGMVSDAMGGLSSALEMPSGLSFDGSFTATGARASSPSVVFYLNYNEGSGKEELVDLIGDRMRLLGYAGTEVVYG